MITEKDLHEYNKWLMEVWNPNQLYIPFAIDAPKAFLDHRSKVKKLNQADVITSACEYCRGTGKITTMNFGVMNCRFCKNEQTVL
jgi:hypothetical protein